MKVAAETDSTVKTSTGSIYRKSDIAQAKTFLSQEKTRSESKSPSAELNKKFQRISSPEILEDIESDEELRRAVEYADFVNPVDRFQQSQTVITSKDTEAGGGRTLAIKRAKLNTAGPSSIPGPKTQDEIALKKCEKKTKGKKSDDKPGKLLQQTAIAVDQGNEQSTSTLDTSNKDVHASSTPKTKQNLEDILDTFQNRNLAPAGRENLADQFLKRGIQKVADDLTGNVQPASEKDTIFQPPQGVSDDSSLEESGVRRSSR